MGWGFVGTGHKEGKEDKGIIVSDTEMERYHTKL